MAPVPLAGLATQPMADRSAQASESRCGSGRGLFTRRWLFGGHEANEVPYHPGGRGDLDDEW